MKTRTITSFIVIGLTLVVVLGQSFNSGASAAPGPTKATFSAQVNKATQASSALASNKGKTASPGTPADQSPYHITVQGQLSNANGGPLPAGNYNITFALYLVANGGAPYFVEGPVQVAVDPSDLFTYQLGTATQIGPITQQLFNGRLYLGIKVGADAEMTPRFELTAAPYAMSLAPGATIRGALPQGAGPWAGVLNGVNDDTTSDVSAGLFGQGMIGVYGNAPTGFGVRGDSNGSTGDEQAAGVVGTVLDYGDTGITAGGVFTASYIPSGYGVFAWGGLFGTHGLGHGVEGYENNPTSIGVQGHSVSSNGVGVSGSAYDSLNHTPGATSAIGGQFVSYDQGSSHVAIQVLGSGHASGGWSTSTGYYMTVKYNGNAPLHPGDALALDGNNVSFENTDVVGAVKATSIASSTIGVAQYRDQVLSAPLEVPGPMVQSLQVDDKATSMQAGDFVEVMVVGQMRMRLAGNPAIGDHVILGSDGSPQVSKAATDSIGRVASLPDKAGMTLVFINFK